MKCSIDGIKGQLALMILVFAGFAATSIGAFGYFYIDSKSSAAALVRVEILQQARFDGIDKRFDGIDERFDSNDRRFDGIDKHMDGLDKRMDSMENRLGMIEGRLDQIVGLLQPKQQGLLRGRGSVDPTETR